MRCIPFALLAVVIWAVAAAVTVTGAGDDRSTQRAEPPVGTCGPASGLPPKG